MCVCACVCAVSEAVLHVSVYKVAVEKSFFGTNELTCAANEFFLFLVGCASRFPSAHDAYSSNRVRINVCELVCVNVYACVVYHIHLDLDLGVINKGNGTCDAWRRFSMAWRQACARA